MKKLLSISDLSKAEIIELIKLAEKIKLSPKDYFGALKGKTLAMIFEKPSTRTRVSFEVAMIQLGGHAINLEASSMQVSRGETWQDTGKTLARYVDIIAARVMKDESLTELAKAGKPVINALSKLEHPCQILADLLTIKEHNKLDKKIVFVGDGNNVCNSLALAAKILNLNLIVSCPRGFEPTLGDPKIIYDPAEAVKAASVIYTDVWTSMGERNKDLSTFSPYQVNEKLLSFADRDAVIMHCLPAHRGQEITSEVIDSQASIVFDQAENRLYMQKAILLNLGI